MRIRFAELVETLPQGSRVLELGSGPGLLAESILERCTNLASYTLLDFSEHMLGLSRDRLKRFPVAQFVNANFKTADWTDALHPPYAAVMAMQAVHESFLIPQTYRYVLHYYPYHRESKLLGPDGAPCSDRTRGLLQRSLIVAGQQHFVGKETDRRWEYGEDLRLKHFKAMEYRPAMRIGVADAALRAQIVASGMRPLMRKTRLSQPTIEAVRAGKRVRHATIQRIRAVLLDR